MTRTAATLAAVLALGACWVEPAERAELERARAQGEELEAQVDELLDASARGWNGGDLQAFMVPYLESTETSYVGAGGLRVGWKAIRRRYAPLFAAGAERDSLRFEELRVRRVSDEVAVGTARWVLHRGEEVTGAGPFTLVLLRTQDGWRIVHDHSSSDPEYIGEDDGDDEAGGDDDDDGGEGGDVVEGRDGDGAGKPDS